MSAPFTIALTESELVVLHDVLGKLSDREDFERLVPDRGDQQAIHNLVCLFERENPISFPAGLRGAPERGARRSPPGAVAPYFE